MMIDCTIAEFADRSCYIRPHYVLISNDPMPGVMPHIRHACSQHIGSIVNGLFDLGDGHIEITEYTGG